MSGPDVAEALDSVREFLSPVRETLDSVREFLDPVREFLDPLVALATAVLVAIRSSFLVFVVAIGVVFLVVSVLLSGHVLPGVNHGITSAMTFILGASAFVYAVLGKVLLQLIGYS